MRSLIPLLLILTGCATDSHYAAQRDQIAAWERVEIAKAQAEAKKYDALALAGRSADPATSLAIALAVGFGRAGEAYRPSQTPVLTDPSDQAYRWAALIVPGVTQLAAVGFGYKLGAIQSDNAAATSIAGYNTMGTLGTAGMTGVRDVALGGFNAFASLPPSSTTTNTLTFGSGSMGAFGNSTITQDNSRRCQSTNPWSATSGAGALTVPWNAGGVTC